MITRKELKESAKNKIRNNTFSIFFKIIGISIIIGVIFSLFMSIISLFLEENGVELTYNVTKIIYGQKIEITRNTEIGYIISFFENVLTFVSSFAIVYYALNYIRDEYKSIYECLNYVKNNFIKIFIISFIHTLLVSISTLCFIIPGIIVIMGLSMVAPILIDNPELSAGDVINKSWNIMKGHKLDLFILYLSFIGWFILCSFILPIIFVVPYVTFTELYFYEKIKN